MATIGGQSLSDLMDQAAGMRVEFGGTGTTPGQSLMEFGTGGAGSVLEPIGGDAGGFGGTFPGQGNPFLSPPVLLDPRNDYASMLYNTLGQRGAVQQYRDTMFPGSPAAADYRSGGESTLGGNLSEMVEAVKQRIDAIMSPSVDNTRRGRFGF